MAAWVRDRATSGPETAASVSAMTDAQLAESPDHDAFLELYDRYVERIERYVAARTMSAVVEDIVSTTFERALARRASFRADRGAFSAWLFTIAHNAIADHYRMQTRIVDHEPPPITPDPGPGPEQAALDQEDRLRVRAALQEVTADQRDALALRFAAELPFAEVSRALGKSESAAKMLVQRGLAALREMLQEANHDS